MPKSFLLLYLEILGKESPLGLWKCYVIAEISQKSAYASLEFPAEQNLYPSKD